MLILKFQKVPLNEKEISQLKSPILILGPAYSGKSEFAHTLLDYQKPAGIIGTSDIEEPNLKKRINELKSLRSDKWDTYENPSELVSIFEKLTHQYSQILIDSVNQWIAHVLVNESAKYSLEQLEEILFNETSRFCNLITQASSCKIVLVSSEVGAGVSPHIAMARVFRQITGRFNTKLTQICNTVIKVSAGIALVIKD